MKKFFLLIIDTIFGNNYVKNILFKIFNFNYFYFFIHLSRYKAIHMVKKGEVCLLCGIFYPSTIKEFSNQVGDTGKVIVVEANIENIINCKKCLDFKNVIYLNNAIWDENKNIEFIISNTNEQGYNRIGDENLNKYPYHIDSQIKKINVEANTIDNILNKLNIKKINHINLTINGAEYQALFGMENVIRNNPKLRLYINSESPEPYYKVKNKLNSLGFCIFTSNLITTINKRIKLKRIYAFLK